MKLSQKQRERGKEQVRKRNEVIREKRASLLFLTFSRVSLQFSSHSRSIPFNFKWTKRARELNGTGTEWTNLIYLWLAVVHFSFIITACLRSTSLPVILKWKGTTIISLFFLSFSSRSSFVSEWKKEREREQRMKKSQFKMNKTQWNVVKAWFCSY